MYLCPSTPFSIPVKENEEERSKKGRRSKVEEMKEEEEEEEEEAKDGDQLRLGGVVHTG